MAQPVQVGDFQVAQGRKSIIGRGSYSIIYKCTDSSGRLAAAKKIDLDAIENVEAIEESEVIPCLKQLRHRNIVSFLHTQRIEPILWIIMECCECDLDQYLAKTDPDMDTCKSLLIQCADAIEFLHSNNIIHRDLKANNVLVKESGSFPIVKVTDFSFAKDLEGHEDSYMSTVRGNVYWLAPELLKPTGELDKQAYFRRPVDMFSLGLLFLYICVIRAHVQQFQKESCECKIHY